MSSTMSPSIAVDTKCLIAVKTYNYDKRRKITSNRRFNCTVSRKHTIYLADISGLDAVTTSNLRRACFKADVKLAVVKNTLLAKAMEASDKDFGDLPTVLKGNTSLMFLKQEMHQQK